jgi:MYXO-CTERM domain-containing protein
MSKTPLLVGLVGALFLASPIASAGQCAVANIGKACAPSNGGGTCLSATCTDTETDGSTTTTACGFCVELPDNYCSGDEGTACGDGGVCSISGGGAGGGGSVGGPSSMVSYSFGTCEVPTEGGACDCPDGAVGPPQDAQSLNATGDDAAAGDDASTGDDASATEGHGGGDDDGAAPPPRSKSADAGPAMAPSDTSTTSSGGGCAVSRTTDASPLVASLAVLGVVLGLRHRRRAAAR